MCEVAAAIDLSTALGFVSDAAAAPMLEIAVELKRMLSAMSR